MSAFFHGPVPAVPPIFSHLAVFAGTLPGDDHVTHAGSAPNGIDAIVSGTSTHMDPSLTAHYEGLIPGGSAHGAEMGAAKRHVAVSAKYEKHRHEMSHH